MEEVNAAFVGDGEEKIVIDNLHKPSVLSKTQESNETLDYSTARKIPQIAAAQAGIWQLIVYHSRHI